MYPLFNKHLDLSKQYFEKLLKCGDIAIDATCGNGHDSLFLAMRILTPNAGTLYTFDIQKKALESAKKLLQENISMSSFERIHFLNMSHEKFPEEIAANSVKLIVYNLGYLPGGDKSITTQGETTITSIKHSMDLISTTGAISITCYPGHPAGKIEEELILQFVSTLDYKTWNCCHHRFINREKSPSLLILQKQ
jgi:tRNA1(Val) A37 N6-methylase TrmN6